MSATADSIEYHLHDDTLQVRHCFPPTKSLLRYHAEFGPDDTAAGWRQVEAGSAAGLSPQDIEQKKAAIAAGSRDYWASLLGRVPVEQRVVAKG